MKTIHACLFTFALLSLVGSDVSAEEEPSGNLAELVLLEKTFLGTWKGLPCGGDYTFRADRTYEVRHYSPGNNTLTGTWAIHWNALPPTLVLTCRASDIQVRDPDRPEYRYFGKPLKTELLVLNQEVMTFRVPEDNFEVKLRRPVEDLPGAPPAKVPMEKPVKTSLE